MVKKIILATAFGCVLMASEIVGGNMDTNVQNDNQDKTLKNVLKMHESVMIKLIEEQRHLFEKVEELEQENRNLKSLLKKAVVRKVAH